MGIRARISGRRKGQARRERELIEMRYEPSARDLFPAMRDRLLASRPVIGTRATFPKVGRTQGRGIVAKTEPIYGPPAFRNVIDAETGEHV